MNTSIQKIIVNNTIDLGELFIIGGPCSIESEEQLITCAQILRNTGAQAIRGGAYKPRTSPDSFQGMGKNGYKLLGAIAKQYNLMSVSEVMDKEQISEASPYIDILQVGSRNSQNYALLKELGKVNNIVLLKRGFSSTYEEFVMSAKYILDHGNKNVILCERGIRTFEHYTRNTLDLNAIPVLQELINLPIIVDPSHGTGISKIVPIMAKAAIAAGANGIMVEMHPNPELSISDAKQTINLDAFTKMVKELKELKEFLKSQ